MPVIGNMARNLAFRTFPRYRPLLDYAGWDHQLIVLGLFSGQMALGLALGRIEASDSAEGGFEAVLLSVSVAKDWQRRGGGLKLLQAFEATARQKGARRFRLRFTMARNSDSDSMLRLTAGAGWNSPILCGTLFVMEREESLNAPWFQQAQQRICQMIVQPWNIIADRALALIDSTAYPPIPEDLHPRQHIGVGLDGSLQDQEASAVLRAGPEPEASIIGWILIHTISRSESRVSVGYVDPDRARGFAYGALLAHANRTLYEKGVQRASFLVRPHETRMIKFAERRIVPLISHIRESLECIKLS